jgi:threonine dehydratase
MTAVGDQHRQRPDEIKSDRFDRDLIVTFHDVVRARERIRHYVAATPTFNYPLLDRELGLQVWLKHENHHAIGCFKARGALNAILAHEGDFSGAVASSSGNHGQGVALAARLAGRRAVIVVPEWASEHKVAAIRALGAEVEVFGDTSHAGRERAIELAEREGLLLLDDFCDPFIVAGNGTVALELLEQQPELEVLIVPLGGGALAAGCGVAAKAINPALRTVAGQSESCPATATSWQRQEPVQLPCSTIADGLAVDLPDAAVVALLVATIDDVVLVSEEEIREAIARLLRTTRNLVEASGAVPVAICRKQAAALEGRRIGAVVSGGNLDLSLLPELLEAR